MGDINDQLVQHQNLSSRPIPPDTKPDWGLTRRQRRAIREGRATADQFIYPGDTSPRPFLAANQPRPLNPRPTPDPVLEGLIRDAMADLRAVGSRPTGRAVVRYVRLRGGHRRSSYIRALAQWIERSSLALADGDANPIPTDTHAPSHDTGAA
jgi:hypothetical protein